MFTVDIKQQYNNNNKANLHTFCMQWNLSMILFLHIFVGFISLEMPLSSDPILGDWKIVANDGFEDVEETFKVDKYGIK